MQKIILIPDSFKGTLSSAQICAIMEQAIRPYYPAADIVSVPVADGGEGSVDAFLQAMGGEKITVSVQGPYFEPLESFYGLLPNGVAVIEMAAAAGLPLVGENRRAEKTTTYGVGQLMHHAIEGGCRKLIIGLGGSATNDGGCGAAAALGCIFRNQAGESFIPVGETLRDIASIDRSAMPAALAETEIVTMCDIDNPLCGELGAAQVFSPQKGADPATVRLLDAGLLHMADIVRRDIGRDILYLNGAGAAGGMGGGMGAMGGGGMGGFGGLFGSFFKTGGVVGQSGGAGNGDLLLLACALILCRDVDDAVCVDVKGYLDLGDASACRQNSVELKDAQ